MQLAYQVLQIVAPVFALAMIGVAWVKAGWRYDVEFVTRLAMTISVPCLIFMALLRTEIDPAALRDTALAALGAYAGVSVVAWTLLRVTGLDLRTYLAPVIFGNTGNIGLPLALFAFGTTGLHFAVVVFAIMAVLSFTIGIWFGLGPVAFGVLVLQLSTPVAVTSYMIAEKYQANSDEVAGLVVVSTLLSVVTIPVALAFLI